jgi:hypothetical protein
MYVRTLDEACPAAGARTLADDRYQAYDSHCNLVLGDVEETIFVAEEEEEDQEPRVRTVKKQSEMLFVRGTQCTKYCQKRIEY